MSNSLPNAGVARDAIEVVSRIRNGGRALVSMSGGVDSSLVAALAFEALAGEAVAVTLTGPSVSHGEIERSCAVAAAIGIEHVLTPADPLARAAYRENGTDRCYHCRSVETTALRDFGRARAVRQYLDGVQRDDLADDRPGLRAMDEAGFLHPLLWIGWGKAEVRSEACRRGLPNWDQPSDACLASRVAHGDAITPDLLARIEAAESAVLARGFRRVRVRVRGGAARVEVDPNEVARLLEEPMSREVLRAVERAGFSSASIDPLGYHGRLERLPTVP